MANRIPRNFNRILAEIVAPAWLARLAIPLRSSRTATEDIRGQALSPKKSGTFSLLICGWKVSGKSLKSCKEGNMPIRQAGFRVQGTAEHGRIVDFTVKFSLEKSSAFSYGNGLGVCMKTSEGADNWFDVRYDKTLQKDGSNFHQWAKKFAEQYWPDTFTITPIKV